MYDYIKNYYKVEPHMNGRVKHKVTGRFGRISREDASAGHYVQVLFDGDLHGLPCHPQDLTYFTVEQEKNTQEK